jgi:hypothetical protein
LIDCGSCQQPMGANSAAWQTALWAAANVGVDPRGRIGRHLYAIEYAIDLYAIEYIWILSFGAYFEIYLLKRIYGKRVRYGPDCPNAQTNRRRRPPP